MTNTHGFISSHLVHTVYERRRCGAPKTVMVYRCLACRGVSTGDMFPDYLCWACDGMTGTSEERLGLPVVGSDLLYENVKVTRVYEV